MKYYKRYASITGFFAQYFRLDSLNEAMDFMNSDKIKKLDNILLNKHAFYVSA